MSSRHTNDESQSGISNAVAATAPPFAGSAQQQQQRHLQAEVPFLVTHWLEHFAAAGGSDASAQNEALQQIRRATAEIASAFAELGAYGTSHRPCFSASSFSQPSRQSNATYSDLRRQWSALPENHLQNLIHAVTTTNSTADAVARASAPTNLLDASREALRPTQQEGGGGRSSRDAIVVDDNNLAEEDETNGGALSSALQAPVLLDANPISNPPPTTAFNLDDLATTENVSKPFPLVALRSNSSIIDEMISTTMRRVLVLRESVRSDDDEIRLLQDSMAKQEQTDRLLAAQRTKLLADGDAVDPVQRLARLDEIKEGGQNCDRVIAQLHRKLTDLQSSNNPRKKELRKAEAAAHKWFQKGKELHRNYRDPFRGMNQCHSSTNNNNGSRMGGNPLLLHFLDRQRGITCPRFRHNAKIDLTNRFPKTETAATTRKTIFCTRLSHAATINTHLNYPVYCLRFDRTGRYFITGADDYLIKVHYLGAGQSCRDKNTHDGSRQLRCNYGANTRGSVLVCSLRGHAGVINDIDVSSDNCFLATASVDGDCRIWGLKDGCPIAILRGHKGGANMVSWSTLTPYRLITTGSDGFARMWDIREACLKRYGAAVGKRPEYRLQLTEAERLAMKVETDSQQSTQRAASQNILPPLPERRGSATTSSGAAASGDTDPSQIVGMPVPPMLVPPIPVEVPPIPVVHAGDGEPNGDAADGNGGGADNNIVLGQFTANDNIDEGVKLLTKYQHGAPGGGAVAGPGTRSKRSAVNVICVARCPIGGHFTTGSDDGICRVWLDSDDCCVSLVDKRFSTTGVVKKLSRRETRHMLTRSSNSDTPLLKLTGHVSAITDLAYSQLGDRLLSASQRDGVVRVWSLGMKLTLLAAGGDSVVERGVTQIVIKLTNPLGGAKSRAPPSRRKGPGNSGQTEASKVSCDVAVWAHGDTRIVTSQSILVKQSGTEIQPGSQYLFLWESRTGHCLLGISGAHTMQCPVVIPHPTDLSLMCSAGADGTVKVWDWESGRCLFTHKNSVEFGPCAENNARTKISGYLDGAFSPDGTGLVLTDDNGRITILDSLVSSRSTDINATDAWVREQYFANDYYELFYDTNGYCVERGSEQPPHLAPRGVRCNHSGTSYPADINEAFRDVVGPLPLPEDMCRWRRDVVRSRSQLAENCTEDFSKSRCSKVRSGVREFDPVNTILIRGPGHVDASEKGGASLKGPPRSDRPAPGSTEREARSMSSNFRWRDYDDIMQDQAHGNDDDEVDSDDEEFEPAAPRANEANNNEDDSEDLDAYEMQGEESPNRVRQRQGGRRSGRQGRRSNEESTGVERTRRAQRRSQRRDTEFVEIGSDEELQIVSTNRTPSGPHVRDYNIAGHLWRLSGAIGVNRSWLRRYESTTSYTGRKIYCPQVGDSLVYIPRAHFETLKEFPSLHPPWQNWPQGTAWPVVRCSVRNIRYRFPYEDYYRRDQASSCKSIVAILSLELTGIPELSENRDFPWPKPSFVTSTRSHMFELSLFENDKCEFVIPEMLYTSRLTALERTLVDSDFSFEDLDIHLYYCDPAVNEEDQEMQLYPAVVKSLGEEEPQSNPHLRGSGFGVLNVDCEEYDDNFSPWEVMVDRTTPGRPGLSEEDMNVVADALRKQMRNSTVREFYSKPVDTERYYDYLNMVEIPIDLSFILRRLHSDYYATKWSVVADIKLIHDNSVKYNGNVGQLQDLAASMHEEFERQVLTEEERGQTRVQSPPTLRFRVGTNSEAVTRQTYNNSSGTSNIRARTRRNSTLEDLPLPQGASRRIRISLGERETRQSTRSLRGREPSPETEVLGRVLRNRSIAQSTLGDLPNQSDDSEESKEESAEADENEQVEAASPELTGEAGDEAAERNSDSSQEEAEVSSQEDEPVVQSRSSKRARVVTRLDHDLENEHEPSSPARALRSRVASNHASLPNGDASVATRSRAVSGPSRQQLNTSSHRTRRSSRVRGSRARIDADAKNESDFSDQNEEIWDDAAEESEEDNDEDEAPTPQSPVRRTRARSDIQPRSRRSRRGDPAEETGSEPLSPRRSNRMPRKHYASYEEKNSDFELEDEESEEEPEEDPKPRRRSGRNNQTYAELPSDFDESDHESDEEFESTRQKSTKAQSKRKRPPSNSSRSQGKRLKKEENLDLPQVKDWPDIEVKDITIVARGILERVKLSDHEQVFAVPVLESYPDLAPAYLNVVSLPMDLRTIEEERLNEYFAIKELQKDLVLIFRNCCTFNAEGSHFWSYAKNIWESLNEIFRETCNELGVLLPRRF